MPRHFRKEDLLMKVWKYLSIMIMGLLAVTLVSCGGSGDESGSAGSTGNLSLSLTDDPASDYQAVYVTISEIQVHRADAEEGEWMTVLTPNTTYNLLDLINGKTAALGVAELPTGKYTQMRLILADTPDSSANILAQPHPYANYLISKTDEAIKLNVPSGFQTGIKLVHSFDVVAGRTVGLILDFDAGRSVVKAGSSGKWQLKPTIKVIDTLNNATLTGTVNDESAIAVSGVTVSAQIYDASAATEVEKVKTVTSTLTDENGNYLMYLTPGTYTIVVVADGFVTSSKQITIAYDTDYTEDFTLAPTDMGIITIELTLPSSGDTATIEFRQTSPSDATQQIAVKEVNYSDTGSYTVNLPVGTYNVVATCAGNILTVNDVADGDTVTIDFTAP
jgi:hypothetical protein